MQIGLWVVILEHLRYFVANLFLSQFTLFLHKCLGPKLRLRNIFDKYDVCLVPNMSSSMLKKFFDVVCFVINISTVVHKFQENMSSVSSPWLNMQKAHKLPCKHFCVSDTSANLVLHPFYSPAPPNVETAQICLSDSPHLYSLRKQALQIELIHLDFLRYILKVSISGLKGPQTLTIPLL